MEKQDDEEENVDSSQVSGMSESAALAEKEPEDTISSFDELAAPSEQNTEQ
jgi:hypothetical protein